MMLPPKKAIEQAFADGTMDRVNRLLSAAHILNWEADVLVEDASDQLKEAGLQMGMLKKLHSDFIKAAERYFREYTHLVTSKEMSRALFTDTEEFDRKFRRWAGIDEKGDAITSPQESYASNKVQGKDMKKDKREGG